MANAKKNVETIETVKGVTLDLSIDEAVYLRDLLGNTSAFGPGFPLFDTLLATLPRSQFPQEYDAPYDTQVFRMNRVDNTPG